MIRGTKKSKQRESKVRQPNILFPSLDIDPYARNPVFNFYYRPLDEFDLYARAFHRAAKTLATKMFSGHGFNDLDACPIIFLYRHAFELCLKSVVLTGSKLLKISGKNLPRNNYFLENHSLERLLPIVKQIFEEVGWRFDFEIKGLRNYRDFCRFVVRLEKITMYSFAFRYPVDKKGESLLPKHYWIDMRNFFVGMDRVLQWFDGAATGLEEMWDVTAEEAYNNQMEGLQ